MGSMSSCFRDTEPSRFRGTIDTYEDTKPSYPILPSQKTEFMWINVKKNGSTNMRFWRGMSNAIRTVGCTI